MIAYIVFLVFAGSLTLALFVGPILKDRSQDHPTLQNSDFDENGYQVFGLSAKPKPESEPIFIVSKTYAEAEQWRNKRNKSRIGIYWVSGPGGLRSVRNAMVVFTGQWQDRDDATELWAQAHEGTDLSIFIDGEPEPVVEQTDLDTLNEDRTS